MAWRIDFTRNADKAMRKLDKGVAARVFDELVDEGGERWRIGSARPLVTVYLLCISVCITLCIRRLLVKRIDEPANQISLRTSSQLGNLF